MRQKTASWGCEVAIRESLTGATLGSWRAALTRSDRGEALLDGGQGGSLAVLGSGDERDDSSDGGHGESVGDVMARSGFEDG